VEAARVGVVVPTAEALAVVVSMEEAFAVALSRAVPVSAGDVSVVGISTPVAFAVAVLTGAIMDSLIMSLSAASAIRGGAGAIRTDITVTAITRTVTMDTADTHMVTMDTVATRTAMDTAGTVTTAVAVMAIVMEAERVMAADQAVPGVCKVGDKPAYELFEISLAHWRLTIES